MNISKDTKEVIKFLDYTTGNNLRKKNDMEIILELGASKGDFRLIEKITFTGKYLWNLHTTIVNSKQDEGKDKLKKEIESSAVELRALLNELITEAEDFNHENFRDKYFEDNIGSFRNLIDLSHDLSRFKEMQNTMKSNKSSIK